VEYWEVKSVKGIQLFMKARLKDKVEGKIEVAKVLKQ